MGTRLFSDLITFTRASSATRVNSSGLVEAVASDQPRFDYDPVTLAPKGLLIEEQRTNLLLASTAVDTLGGWSKGTNTTRVGQEVMLGLTFTIYQGNGSGSNTFVSRSFAVTAGAVYTVSIYARLVSGSIPTSGALITCETTPGSPAIRQALAFAGSGLNSTVARYSTTFTAGGSGSVSVYFVADQNNTAQIAVSCAQLEQGAFPTSYIPTTTAAATRAADVATITGSNFSSWYRQGEGTLLGEVISSNGTVCFGVGNTFSDTMYATRGTANNISFRSGGADQAVLSAPFNAASGYANKVVFAYMVNDFAAVSNGGVVSKDTSGAVSSNMVRLNLGSSAWDTSGGNSINGHICRITYYPRRLTDAELQALTS